MANAENGKIALEEMYNLMKAGISAGTTLIGGNLAKGITVWMGGVTAGKNQAMNPEDNHYEAVGRFVGDSIGVLGSLMVGGQLKNLSLKIRATGSATTSQLVAHIGLGDSFASLFNTYVANADAFYTKILTDENYANEIWDGIVANKLKDYFDSDHDGVVSPYDIVNGFKELFSPPPAFGTEEFYLEYNSEYRGQVTVIALHDSTNC